MLGTLARLRVERFRRWEEAKVSRTFTEQELAEFLFDRLIVQGPSCPDTSWLRPACEQVAEELLNEAEVLHKSEPISDGGA
jgi:hypothetical protein